MFQKSRRVLEEGFVAGVISICCSPEDFKGSMCKAEKTAELFPFTCLLQGKPQGISPYVDCCNDVLYY